jgi:hypothetical protein
MRRAGYARREREKQKQLFQSGNSLLSGILIGLNSAARACPKPRPRYFRGALAIKRTRPNPGGKEESTGKVVWVT